MNGLTSVVADLYHAIEPDLKVSAIHAKYISNSDSILSKLKNIEGIDVVSFSIEENALIMLEDKQAEVKIKGVDVNFKKLTQFDTVVTEGVYRFEYKNQYYGVFGRGIANKIGVNVNDFITPISIYAPKRGKVESINPDDLFNKVTISPAGVFALNDDFDFKYVLIDFKQAQELFDCPDAFTTIEIGVKDKSQILDLQTKIQQTLGSGFQIKNRYQVNDVLFKTLETEKLIVFLILGFILIIATLNIIGALTMLIIEKKKDIKTLYNLGANQRFIRTIFMKEGFLISGVGALSGLILGFGVCLLQQQFHLVTFDDQYVIPYYPIDMRLTDFLWVLLIVMVIGFTAAIYPVRIFTKNDLIHV